MKKIFLLILFTAASAASQNYEWAVADGSYNEDRAFGVAADNFGNVFATGFFKSEAIFGSTTFTGFGVEDVFVAKYDSAGNVLWARQFGGQSNDIGYDIVTDAVGNCYVTGSFKQTATFGNIVLQSSGISAYDAFVVKLDPNGNVLWAQKGGGADWDESRGIAISADQVCIGGNFTGPAVFGSATIDDAGLADVYLARYDLDGNFLGITTGGGTAADFINGVASDGLGNFVATGYFQGTANFGSLQVINGSNAYTDVFTIKISPSGAVQWAKRGGGPTNDDIGRAITADAAGNVFVTGEVRDSGNFESTNYTGAGIADVFIVKYNPEGVAQYLTINGNDGGDYAYGIDEHAGKLFITGLFLGIVQFGGTTLTSAGSTGPVSNDIFLASLDASTGLFENAVRAGGNGSDAGRAVDVSSGGVLFQAGDFQHSSASFAPYTLASAGSSDLFVGRLAGTNLGVIDIAASEFTIYPNPAFDRISASFGDDSQAAFVKIVNVTGQTVFSGEILSGEPIGIAHLTSGIYVLQVQSLGRPLLTAKFIKL